jgi:decaprenylphospho-beta-D-erythro-pentofuranosid-2-ulose 2-reductase
VANVLILGGTSAIARAVAAEFAAHKFDLILAGRDCEELSTIGTDLSIRYGVRTKVQFFDILDFESHQAALESCLSEGGRAIMGAVLCIGYLGNQGAAQVDPEEAGRILHTNFTGCVSVLNLLANYFEKRGRGFITAVSSVAGDRGRQTNYFYGAAKAGLTTYLQGLRNRLYHSGIQVLTIKPGFVDTRMTYGRPNLLLLASPETVARGIYQAVVRRKDVVYLPWFWRWIMLAVGLIPEAMFKRLRL